MFIRISWCPTDFTMGHLYRGSACGPVSPPGSGLQSPDAVPEDPVLGRTPRALVGGGPALSAFASLPQQQSLSRHPVRGGAGSPAREPAQAPQVSAGLPGSPGPGWFAKAGRWVTLSLFLRFLETVELQISLKNYDPQKDKRFSGTVRLAPF